MLLVVGVFTDPDIDASGRELAQAYAENPGREQVSALAFHFAFVMWAPIVFALVGLIRLPLVLFAAWRGGLVRAWVPIAFAVAIVAAEALDPFGSGLLILAAALVGLAYVLSRIEWRSREAST